MSKVLQDLSLAGIVPVIAVQDAGDAVGLCTALRDGGLPVAEITFRTQAAQEAIRQVHAHLPEVILGAGTVLTTQQVDQAVAAGASYIVSPGFNPRTVLHCQQLGIPIIAGCASPTELELAIEMGLETVKFFPAEALGGLPMIKALSAPFGQVRFMPTGGIGEHNLLEYLAFPKVAACGGSFMVPQDAVKAKDWKRIETLTRRAVNLMLGFSLARIDLLAAGAAQADQDARDLARLFGEEVTKDHAGYLVGNSLYVADSTTAKQEKKLTIACNQVDRAVWHLKLRGFAVDEASRKVANGVTQSIRLGREFAGFFLELVKK